MNIKVNKKDVTIEAVLRKSHTNAIGQHPVKVRVTYNRNAKFYPISIDGKPLYLKESDWTDLNTIKVRKEKRNIKTSIEDRVASARAAKERIVQNGRVFSFERFENEFLLKTSEKGFIGHFEEYLDELLIENRVGSYHTYHCALQSFKAFRKNREIDPGDITPELLRDFEKYLLSEKSFKRSNGKVSIRKAGKTTVGIYMRTLRAVFNYVSGKMPHLKEGYPFAHRNNDRTKYKIKTGSGSKGEALTADQLRIFINSDVITGSSAWKAKQLWLFSLYCQGMNMNDIARLKYKHILSESIRYVRSKTKETENKEEVIEIPLNNEIRTIIVQLGNPEKNENNYVFDLLTQALNPVNERKTINQRIKVTNKWLKKICQENNLPPITTYWARHTYASLLKFSGVSVEMIRELLGHADIKTTENYLKRFDLEKKREVNEKIHAIMLATA
jgi:integrase/recombinase XerD